MAFLSAPFAGCRLPCLYRSVETQFREFLVYRLPLACKQVDRFLPKFFCLL
jgi:hypothetical protein